MSGVGKLSNYMSNLENAISVLELIEKFLQMLENKPVTREDTDHLQTSVENFNSFFVRICRVMTSYEE